MKKYICPACGYIYLPEKGDKSQHIDSGVPFEELPGSWRCPVCGVTKREFKEW